MPIGTTAAILLGIGAAGAGIAATSMAAPKAPSPATPLPLPQPPNQSASSDAAQKTIQRRTADVTQSIYTGPLGIQDQANVAKKVLLGT